MSRSVEERWLVIEPGGHEFVKIFYTEVQYAPDHGGFVFQKHNY
jgi:hypothetical protein